MVDVRILSELRVRSLHRSGLEVAREILRQSCPFDTVASVAEEKLFFDGAFLQRAEPLAVLDDTCVLGVACTSQNWLRLLAVKPEYRGQGVGSLLLRACEEQMATHNEDIRLMAQPGNYLSPGIDVRNIETIRWLEKRGYHSTESDVENLLIALQNNPTLDVKRQQQIQKRVNDAGYEIVRLTSEQSTPFIIRAARQDVELAAKPIEGVKDAWVRLVVDWVEQHFSAGWAFEVLKSASRPTSGVFVASEKKSQKIVGFAAHDGNNTGLGWFGPTGTLPKHRGQGIGGALYMACLRDLQEAGHRFAEVAWIGPRAFYESLSGISSTRRFRRMKKQLKRQSAAQD